MPAPAPRSATSPRAATKFEGARRCRRASSRCEARNQNAKGVGLGLAIARDVARGHGGDVVLAQSPLGGLRATVTLPG